MKASLLFAVLALAVLASCSAPSKEWIKHFKSHPNNIDSLPGYKGSRDTLLGHAGYVTVDSSTNANLFYWLVPSTQAPRPDTPLVVWLNGGPGASSMIGAFFENGAFTLTNDANGDISIVDNPYSWAAMGANILYWDQPVGTGYSYCDPNGYVTNETQLADQFATAMQAFFDLYPAPGYNFKTAPLYLAGESYAGKYIPAIATRMLEMNRESPAAPPFNLTAIMMGNGLYDPLTQFAAVPANLMNLGFIDNNQYNAAMQMWAQCEAAYNAGQNIEAFNLCQNMSNVVFEWAGNPFLYDIRVGGDPLADVTSDLSTYLNTPSVMEQFGTVGHPWTMSDGTSVPNNVSNALLNDDMIDITDTLVDLIEALPVLIYNGQFDASCCSHYGSTQVFQNLEWSGQEAFLNAPNNVWTYGGGSAPSTGGLVRKSGSFTYVIVAFSGHIVGYDQPAAFQNLFSLFLQQQFP